MRLIDEVICKMSNVLNSKQLDYLRFVLTEVMQGQNKNEIAIRENQNEKFLKLFMVEMKIQNKADGTIRQYVKAAEKFLLEIGKDVRDIVPEDTVLYFAKMMHEGKTSLASMDNTRRYLRTFFAWLTDADYIRKNPMLRVKPIKHPEKPKEILTDDEIELIRDACETPKDKALVDFLACTGVRVSEVINLTWDRVQIEAGMAQIFASKTQNWRCVYLDARARKHLRDLKKVSKGSNNDLVFYKAKQTIEKHLRELAVKAGVHKRCTVHVFRRTFVSRMYRRGMGITDIAKLCGHATTATTVKYYLTIDDDDIRYRYSKIS